MTGGRRRTSGVRAGPDGAFTFADIPSVSGAITYDVLWNGNSNFRWSRTLATVTVARQIIITVRGRS
ncbi:hypothetical protein ABT294_42495 [Nonomuraea sp. NPDC000554]|uniref:hypothetical protein n=1 Tax=Nonomuraea sp. NPDC000554 TaxID=3154259 RepID=UPI003322C887